MILIGHLGPQFNLVDMFQ